MLKQFQYNNQSISFQIGEETFINATQMAKPFNKRPIDFLRLPSTNSFISELSKVRKSHFGNSEELVITVKGGNDTSKRGTWMHEDVALEFARWLSPAFAIWCNQKIKELLTTGKTALQDLSPEELYLLTVNKLKKTVDQQQETIRELQPHAQYAKEVLESKSDHTITSIAKELDMSGRKLNQILKQRGIIFKQDGHYVIKAQYQGLGYTKTRTHKYVDSKGEIRTSLSTVYTEKGRRFIHRIINGTKTNQPLKTAHNK